MTGIGAIRRRHGFRRLADIAAILLRSRFELAIRENYAADLW